jgi:hypothetical protein
LHLHCQVVFGRWSRFSQPSSADEMPGYFVTRCMESTFHGSSEERPHLRPGCSGARGALLSVLAHFFVDGRWGSVVQEGAEGQSLAPEDRLFILAQAGLYLTATRGLTSPDAQICYERGASLMCFA